MLLTPLFELFPELVLVMEGAYRVEDAAVETNDGAVEDLGVGAKLSSKPYCFPG